MQTKLTLSLEDNLIQQAKLYAKSSGKSLSQVVAEYFTALSPKTTQAIDIEAKPVTEKLLGCLGVELSGDDDYQNYLERKYQ